MGIGLTPLVGLVSVLWADESVPWYLNHEVDSVSVVNEDGFVPQGELHTLLATQVGEPLQLDELRSDMTTLYTMGNFAEVEVDLLNESWDDSNTVLHVRFRLQESPTLTNTEIVSPHRRLNAFLRQQLYFSKGQVFYPSIEIPRLESFLLERLSFEGWSDVLLSTTFDESSGVLTIEVQQAILNTCSDIVFVNLPKGLERRSRRILKDQGIQVGHRLPIRNIQRARNELHRLFRDFGWVNANARFVVQPTPTGQAVHVLVEQGKHIDVEIDFYPRRNGVSKRLNSTKDYLDLLDIFDGEGLSERDIPRFTEAILDQVIDDGYWDATVQLQMVQVPSGLLLKGYVTLGPQHQIHELTMVGNSIFSIEEIKSTIAYDRPNLIESRILSKMIFSREDWFDAIDAIEQAYFAQGYLDAQVTYTDEVSEFSNDTKQLHSVQLNIEEGEPFDFGQVNIRGGFSDLNEPFVKRLSGRYQPKDVQVWKNDLLDAYREQGFLNVTVSIQQRQTPQQSSMDIDVDINVGNLVLLRNVGVRGNRLTKRTVIDDALDLTVGKPITPSILEDVRNDLNQLNVFEGVSLSLQGEDPTKQDLLISVDEDEQWAIRTGGAVASDLGALAIASVSNRNVRGLAHQASLLGQFGYAWMDDSWSFDSSEPIWRLATTFTAPKTPLSFTNFRTESIFQEIIQQPNYRLVQSGLGMGLSIAPTRNFNLLMEYRIRRMVLDDFEPALLLDGEPWSVISDDPQPSRWWSGVQGSVVLDYRDDPFNPTEGIVLSGEARIGDGLINNLPTVRMTGGMTLIHPMNALKSIVSVSWGIARTNDDSPLTLEERFFMGGSNSMRGFARNQVGPANSRLWTDFDFPEQLDGVVQEGFYEQSGNRWVPTGGDSFALANLELHLPIGGIDVDTASVVLFTDIGRLQFISAQVQTDSINQQLDPLFRYSTGVGFRYGTVIGPIAFDLGINPQPLLERGEVYFVPHLSFGSL